MVTGGLSGIEPEFGRIIGVLLRVARALPLEP